MTKLDEAFVSALKATAKWAIGDQVIVRLPQTPWHGLVGTIIAVRVQRFTKSIGYEVKFEDGRIISVDELSLRNPKASPTPDQPYESIADRKGNPLHPGDRVRIKRYPRGTVEGVVVISKTVMVAYPDGTQKRALSVLDEVDGTIYELISKGALKIK